MHLMTIQNDLSVFNISILAVNNGDFKMNRFRDLNESSMNHFLRNSFDEQQIIHFFKDDNKMIN